MISKECFVYLQLPNTFDTVTIGKFKWEKTGANSEVGSFVYGRSYLKNAKKMALDPFNLPLEEREFQVTLNEGVHGPFRDASPDSWGRYVIQKNTPPDQHDSMGYLLNSAGDRIGALSFGFGKTPPSPVRTFNKTIDLEKLIEAAHKLENDQPIDEVEKVLLMAGSSAGGARPKTTVESDNNLWIAKFPASNDKQNFSRIEYTTMKLAKYCGLNVPDIKLIQVGAQEVFLIKRFDRVYNNANKDYYRHHFVSGLTLLNLDENDSQKWSYIDMADQMRRWIINPTNDLQELFKRIVFNGLVSNTDDHPRNHGFINNGNGYRLSQVYDLVPKPETGTTRYLAMPFGKQGRVFSVENLVSESEAFDLTSEEAISIDSVNLIV
ncbi:MAG TPA: type II toxin-antitoxin system HipA family toxin [Pseudobdellovibrionaceae bacterium]|nr:type II toxin-antitoxin system HipA family toxin [Pseudobdellovibrionaceae bacterium]